MKIQRADGRLSGSESFSEASPTRSNGEALVGGADRSPCTSWQVNVERHGACAREEMESFAPQLGGPTRLNR